MNLRDLSFPPSVIARISLLVLTCLVLTAQAGERVGWMYNADVPVTNQSPQARAISAQEGFRQVLGRLTGQGDALTLNVSGMAADRLISTFSYHSEIVDGRRQPRVKMSFNPSQTLATVRRAGLPVWGSGRPVVKLYLLVEGADGNWRPLTKGEPAELAMQKRAWIRGIKLSVQDFTENAVPVRQMLLGEPEPEEAGAEGDVASGTGAANFTVVESAVDARSSLTAESGATGEGTELLLEEAEPPPEPFLPGVIPAETELVVVGELRFVPMEGDPRVPPAAATPPPVVAPVRETAGGPSADAEPMLVAEQFRYAWGRERHVVRVAEGTVEEQAVQLVDRVVDQMADTLGVPWVNVQSRAFAVAGVREIADYATLMRYLGRLEYVEQVSLQRSAPDRLELSLTTPAAAELLDRLFLVDGLLVRNEESQAPDRLYQWQN
jgi:Uncharacterized protein conserved in bacteria (DUF2066)